MRYAWPHHKEMHTQTYYYLPIREKRSKILRAHSVAERGGNARVCSLWVSTSLEDPLTRAGRM